MINIVETNRSKRSTSKLKEEKKAKEEDEEDENEEDLNFTPGIQSNRELGNKDI